MINVTKILQLKGFRFVEPPKFIKNKHAVLNTQNKDNRWFLHSFMANLYPASSNRSYILKFFTIILPMERKTQFHQCNSDVPQN